MFYREETERDGVCISSFPSVKCFKDSSFSFFFFYLFLVFETVNAASKNKIKLDIQFFYSRCSIKVFDIFSITTLILTRIHFLPATGTDLAEGINVTSTLGFVSMQSQKQRIIPSPLQFFLCFYDTFVQRKSMLSGDVFFHCKTKKKKGGSISQLYRTSLSRLQMKSE